jgi:hypothetical protein
MYGNEFLGFFQRKDTTHLADDPYKERLQLRLEGIPDTVPRGGAINVRAIVTLDGEPYPVLPFPTDIDGEPDPDIHSEWGTAIGAVAVFLDKAGDLDELVKPFVLEPVDEGVFGGSDADSTDVERMLHIKVVVRFYIRQEDTPGAIGLNGYRTALATVQIVDQPSFEGRDDVWLIEHLKPMNWNYYSAKARRLETSGQSAQANGFNLPTLIREPGNYRLNRNALELDSEHGRLLLLHGTEPPNEDKELKIISPSGDVSTLTPPINPVRAVAYYPDEDLLWFIDDHKLVLVRASNMQQTLREVSVNGSGASWGGHMLAIDRTTGDVWIATDILRKFGRDGRDLEIPAIRDLALPGQNRRMLLHSMDDGGVLCFAMHGPLRLVRVDQQGNIVASSDATEHLLGIIEMGANPVTGRVAAVHRPPWGGAPRLWLFNPALKREKEYPHDDPVFAGAFDHLYSADISASRTGERIWITGYRQVGTDINGNPIYSAVVGYLDENEQFELVLSSGVSKQTLVRAF